ncbi:hypothetical protein EQU24_08280 [Methylotuvimicrobium buryatense]|uniref:Uncharacterized protein n=1 Tax=Methylotuvimicrobium buryatense TaxID=95641 RepID=A0A4P9URF1_METBY|nr:hypothetical protein EQU24_08280 [Methylotuvimicrobium buryatense]
MVWLGHVRNVQDGVTNPALFSRTKTDLINIPFALQISAVHKEAPGCSAKALPSWDLFTASFDGHPGAEF